MKSILLSLTVIISCLLISCEKEKVIVIDERDEVVGLYVGQLQFSSGILGSNTEAASIELKKSSTDSIIIAVLSGKYPKEEINCKYHNGEFETMVFNSWLDLNGKELKFKYFISPHASLTYVVNKQ